ncbi:MAG TPA: hypothetical protein VLA94_06450 [Syntrophales bacterium]|nr:hypothetical protein [Syntrophales bacterium]
MSGVQKKAELKSFSKPDEVRTFPEGKVELVNIGGAMVGRATFEQGDDGTEFDSRAGDVTLLPVGHDAWVVGNEPVVIVDFQGMLDYARSK